MYISEHKKLASKTMNIIHSTPLTSKAQQILRWFKEPVCIAHTLLTLKENGLIGIILHFTQL